MQYFLSVGLSFEMAAMTAGNIESGKVEKIALWMFYHVRLISYHKSGSL